MADTEYTFSEARTRLEDIVTEVRKKDMSLEASLDLLEEGVRLANACTEKIDQSEWRSVAEDEDVAAPTAGAEADAHAAPEASDGAVDEESAQDAQQ